MENTVHLVIESGGRAAQFSVPPEGGRLGRSGGNDFVVEDPQLSRHHCRFFFKHGELWVADLGSANGTEVNGRGVQEMQLRVNDRIHVGDTDLKVVNDGVRSLPAFKKDQIIAPVAEAWPQEEEEKQRRAWVPVWIELPAWALLLAWLVFVAYSLVLKPVEEKPVDEKPLEEKPPAEAAPAIDTAPVAAAPEAPVATNGVAGPGPADRMDRLEREVARCLVREDFRSALDRIRKEPWPDKPDPQFPLEDLKQFVAEVSTMNAVVAAALAGRIGRETPLRYGGQELTVVPQAVAGANISVVKSGETDAVTIPVSALDPRERSRWLGASGDPGINAMQFILLYEARDYEAAARCATNSGLLSAAFAELAAEKK